MAVYWIYCTITYSKGFENHKNYSGKTHSYHFFIYLVSARWKETIDVIAKFTQIQYVLTYRLNVNPCLERPKYLLRPEIVYMKVWSI